MIFKDGKGNPLTEGTRIAYPMGLGMMAEGMVTKCDPALVRNGPAICYVTITFPMQVQRDGSVPGLFAIKTPEENSEIHLA